MRPTEGHRPRYAHMRIIFKKSSKTNKKLRGGYLMTNKDTLCLLKECDSGTKMAASSIDEILDKTENIKLKQLLSMYLSKLINS